MRTGPLRYAVTGPLYAEETIWRPQNANNKGYFAAHRPDSRVVENEVGTDDTRRPPLVGHDLFHGRPRGRSFWRESVGAGIVVKGQFGRACAELASRASALRSGAERSGAS